MKSFALLSLLVASSMAGPTILEESLIEPLPQFNQRSNSATGEYDYTYSGGPTAKSESRASDGTTTGTYTYVDAHGLLQTVNYIADEFGFRAAGTNIPVDGITPADAPDVAIAKAAHHAEHSRQALNALTHRKKRGIYAAPIFTAPAAVEVRSALPGIATTSFTQHLPVATSHQSRFQIHNGAKIIEQVHTPLLATAVHPAPLLFRKKRSLLETPIVAAAPLPASSAKIYDELAQKPIAYAAAAPAFAAAPAAVEVRSALPAITTTSYTQNLPLATSSQSRFQIHNGAKIIEQTSLPIYAPAAPAFPVAFPGHFAPAFPAAPFAPAYPAAPFAPAYPAAPIAPAYPAAPTSEAVYADGDAITVESA